MILRLLWGILNGFLADLTIRLNRHFQRGPESWFARTAAFAILRACSLGGGIDDGIAHLTVHGAQRADALRRVQNAYSA